MPATTEKDDVKKRRSIYGPPRWSYVSSAPGTEAKFQRWNVVLIAILAFLVLGMFLVAKAPEPGSSAPNATTISPKVGNFRDSASAQRIRSNSGPRPARANRRSSEVTEPATSGHPAT
jgi:hypothetical protein